MVKYPDSDKTCRKGAMSSWIVLIFAGVCESVWATALGKSQGFTKIVPDILFIVGLILSMMGVWPLPCATSLPARHTRSGSVSELP